MSVCLSVCAFVLSVSVSVSVCLWCVLFVLFSPLWPCILFARGLLFASVIHADRHKKSGVFAPLSVCLSVVTRSSL